MRKSLILTVLLLVLAASSLCYAHGWVDGGKDAVAIDETVLYGDKSVAEGITLDIRTHCDYRLFWDTRYAVGEGPETSTDFAFSQAEKRPSRTIPYSGIYFDGTFNGYGISSPGGLEMADQAAPNQDVASRTGPGEKRIETVYVKDYYDFYPIQVEFDRPSGFAINQDTQQLFANYFRIPVYPEHRVEISVEKNSAGNVHSISLSTVEDSGVFLDTHSVVIGTEYFFTVLCHTAAGKPLDTSYIAGGYGIYHFPLHDQGGDDRILTADELQMVFAIDAERAEVVALQTNTDKNKLLLVTIEDGTYMLTVIDAETMTQLQRLEILKADESVGFRSLYIHDGFAVPVLSDGRFALLATDTEGNYQFRFAADFSSSQEHRYIFSHEVSMDYNGEELAVAAFQNGYFAPQNYCRFYLAVYDRTGLAYAGKYQHSLDKSLIEHPLTCLPLDEAALTVTWGD